MEVLALQRQLAELSGRHDSELTQQRELHAHQLAAQHEQHAQQLATQHAQHAQQVTDLHTQLGRASDQAMVARDEDSAHIAALTKQVRPLAVPLSISAHGS